jgi:hypothetical protein
MALLLTEMTLFFHDIATTSSEKPSGPLRVKTWTAALANQRATMGRAVTKGQKHVATEANYPEFPEIREHAVRGSVEHITRDQSLTFGPCTKKGLSGTRPHSHSSSMPPSVLLTPSNSEPQAEGTLNVARSFHGENDDLNEFGSVLGKQKSSTVCCSTLCSCWYKLICVCAILSAGSQS